ncbi:MAG: penicillin-binding protein 2 [Gammaproteobacteria bacterium]|nr:penicillin-binding protein 2 [Gammaproteobacteria bacterium]
MFVLTAVLISRLIYLQLIYHDHYTTLSRENRLKILPIAPTRGLIYSNDGVLLADNRASFALEVIPERVKHLRDSIDDLRQFIALEPEQIERFEAELIQKRRFDEVTLKSNLTEEEVAIFAVNRHRFPGFEIAARLARYYPLGSQFAHVIGYVGRINTEELNRIDPANYSGTTHIGKEGVEKAREELLHGKAGYQQVEVNAQGRILRVVERDPPVSGLDIHLTIDTQLQAAAIKAMAGRKGAVVAMEPSTGAVLAFVSNPAFDPNEFVNGISSKLYSVLRDSPDRPLFNRALQGLYPPGSTVKPLMALAGLEYGVRKSTNTTWCPGWLRLAGQAHQYRCWQKSGHGAVALSRSLAESCDVYYYSLAKDLGIDRIHEMLSQFGLGKITGIDLPGEIGGLLPSREWKRRTRKLPWYPGETLINGIGQGFMLSTPLQLAQFAAVVGSRGAVHVPHVVANIEDPTVGRTEVMGVDSRASVQLGDDKNWELVIEGMHEVVQGARGTARATAVGAEYQYAGKTGTAQLFKIAQNKSIEAKDVLKHLRDHALFVAFAPLQKPQLALGIIVENGESGSKAAAPIARTLFDLYLDVAQGELDANG